jgi:RNA polymerase sigma-70 factor, ECF subfamily
VDDLVQDVLVRVHRGVGELRNEERFGPWLYRVARSVIVDHRRARARHPMAIAEAPDVDTSDFDEGSGATLERTCGVAMLELVNRLPAPYRDAVRMAEIDGLSQKEIAKRLGLSLAATKSRVLRGRVQLRAAFEKCCAVTVDARGRLIGCETRPGPRQRCSAR